MTHKLVPIELTTGRGVRAVRDVYGEHIEAGDIISFSYGIPPIKVIAPVIERDGKLIALTDGHKPHECNVRTLKKHVGEIQIHKKAEKK